MARDDDGREVIYLVRDQDSPLKYLFVGAAVGAGLALLFAPTSGEETRQTLRNKASRLRSLAEEGIDELEDRLSDGTTRLRDRVRDTVEEVKTQAGDVTDAVRTAGTTARDELERRLADARARRRNGATGEEPEEEPEEEPVA